MKSVGSTSGIIEFRIANFKVYFLRETKNSGFLLKKKTRKIREHVINSFFCLNHIFVFDIEKDTSDYSCVLFYIYFKNSDEMKCTFEN